MSMKEYACFVAVMVLFTFRVDATCQISWESIYKCDGGVPADLDTIPDNATQIYISNTAIDRINRSLVSRFGSTLERLMFQNCTQLVDIDDDAFRNLSKLRSLDFSDTGLTKVKTAWFNSTVSLQMLMIHGNKIDYIEKDAFRNLSNLTHLAITGTNLKQFKTEWFGDTGLPRLSCLNLSYNNIDNIENNMFGRFPSLRTLLLVQCNLTEVKVEWFGSRISVINLYLDDNKIQALDELIDKPNRLAWIGIASNDLRCADIRYILKNLPDLKVLQIYANSYNNCRDRLQKIVDGRNISLGM